MKTIKTYAVLIFLSLFGFTCLQPAEAQVFKKLKKKAEKTATKKLEEKTEKETNEAMDAVLNNDGENAAMDNGNRKDSDVAAKGNTGAAPGSEKEKIQLFSKGDWVAGENLILFEDFSNDAVGDFPQLWNTSSSGEVVKMGSDKETKWLRMYNYSTYQPDLPRPLPKDFTIEFDAIGYGISKEKTSQVARFTITLGDGKTPLKGGRSYAYVQLPVFQGWVQAMRFKSAMQNRQVATGQISKDIRAGMRNGCHIAVSVKGQRYRLYVDGQKMLDLPRAMPPDEEIDALLFSTYGLKPEAEYILLTNLRIAEGLPEPSEKLFSKGRYVTTAILFDVNSSEIKPQSYGTLREIADAMKAEPEKKILVVGHTDSDGSDVYNQELSQKRAAAVKEALVNHFDVQASRLTTEGNGESDPAAANDTALNKARNRRTEFIVQ